MDAGRLTDGLFWQAALVVALLDAVLVAVLAWRLPRPRFRRLLPALWIVTPLFWAAIYGWLAGTVYWDACYRFISLPGHLNGFRMGLLEKCPMLVGVTPVPALVFGMFEFAFYWSVILTLAALAHAVFTRRNPVPKDL